jgi:hypothetical protein
VLSANRIEDLSYMCLRRGADLDAVSVLALEQLSVTTKVMAIVRQTYIACISFSSSGHS